MSEARILLADDDPSIRQLVCTIVRRERLEVDCVADGAEAIEHLREHDYAVVLLDLMMPRVDGFGVIDWMKKHPARVKPVVLVITAYADQKFKQVDANMVAGVLRKPFEIAELGNLVRLCVTGFDADATQRLYSSDDRTIRDLARQNVPVVDRGDDGSSN
ncbi:MAG TPA: response regulator [Thermoanaerobaculia bacterium]|nr:response regulator [Thermoanaerobaculia bacterium]